MPTKSREVLVEATPQEIWDLIHTPERQSLLFPNGLGYKITKSFREPKVGQEMTFRGKGLNCWRKNRMQIIELVPPTRYAVKMTKSAYKSFIEEHEFCPEGNYQTRVRTTFRYELHWIDQWEDKARISKLMDNSLIAWQEAIQRAVKAGAKSLF